MSSILIGSVGAEVACLIMTTIAIISATVNTDTMISINWAHSSYSDSEYSIRHYIGIYAAAYKLDTTRGIHVTDAVFYDDHKECSGDFCHICSTSMKTVLVCLASLMGATVLSLIMALRRYYRSNSCFTKTGHVLFSMASVALGVVDLITFSNGCLHSVKNEFKDESFKHGLAFILVTAATCVMFIDVVCSMCASTEDAEDRYKPRRGAAASSAGRASCCCFDSSAVVPSGSDVSLYPQLAPQQREEQPYPYQPQSNTNSGLSRSYPAVPSTAGHTVGRPYPEASANVGAATGGTSSTAAAHASHASHGSSTSTAAAAARSRAQVYGDDEPDDHHNAPAATAGNRRNSRGNDNHGSASGAPAAAGAASHTTSAARRSYAQVYGDDDDEDDAVPAASNGQRRGSANDHHNHQGSRSSARSHTQDHHNPPTAHAEEYIGTLCGDDPPEAIVTAVTAVHPTEEPLVVHAQFV